MHTMCICSTGDHLMAHSFMDIDGPSSPLDPSWLQQSIGSILAPAVLSCCGQRQA